MILFLVVVTIASTVITVVTRPPTYRAVASVRVAIDSPSVADVGRLDWFTAGILFSTIQETILSRSILQQVIEQNWLGTTPEEFRKAIGVNRVGSSNMLNIQVKSADPETAKKLANDIATAFIQYNQNLLNTQNASSISYYEEQVKMAEGNYKTARENFLKSINEPNARVAENQFVTAQTAYQSAVDKRDAAALLNRFPDLRPASVAIAEPAVTPTQPEPRQLSRYLLLSLLVSLVLSIFIAVAIEYLDVSIKSPHQVTGELGLAVVGVIPHFQRGLSGFASVLANLDLPVLSPFLRWRMRRLEASIMSPEQLPLDSIEAFRKARVSLAVSHRQRVLDGKSGPSTVLITSSRPRDGKTTVTAHLGVSLSKAGYRVLLVDGDLRQSQLHLHFGLEPEGPGLSHVLQGEATLDQAARSTAYPHLSVVLSGTFNANQPDYLDSDRFSELLAHLGENHDFVLVDSPAVGLFTDGAVLASRIGHVLLVVDATRPSSENEFRTLALLADVGAVVEGIIVNKIDPDYVDPTKLHSLPRRLMDARMAIEGHGTWISPNGHFSMLDDSGSGLSTRGDGARLLGHPSTKLN
ncbi:MAG: polysaccharide biosynthesis tyrosine autokinase [Chloroflexota bacterium]|nr:MAG: polysaccharide biosynthesis tyrosine autokinase [Chloroflexota bacterium]